ncbi:hypothetical protein DENSPDRAFT_164427 [Dentipellis sp. KUC8613]|nr:hypothetical protein DENSPDRAFT_164427 [Dentipellis sp. KUC8613]
MLYGDDALGGHADLDSVEGGGGRMARAALVKAGYTGAGGEGARVRGISTSAAVSHDSWVPNVFLRSDPPQDFSIYTYKLFFFSDFADAWPLYSVNSEVRKDCLDRACCLFPRGFNSQPPATQVSVANDQAFRVCTDYNMCGTETTSQCTAPAIVLLERSSIVVRSTFVYSPTGQLSTHWLRAPSRLCCRT